MIEKKVLTGIAAVIGASLCCITSVLAVLAGSNGVVSAKASTQNKNAVIEFDKTKTDIQSIMKAIAITGYKPLDYEDKSDAEKQGSNK